MSSFNSSTTMSSVNTTIITSLSRPIENDDVKFKLSVVSYFLLFLLVFGMSATVDINSFACQLKNRAGILTGVSLQFGLLPLVGFCVVKALDMDEVYGVSLLVVTSSPGGSFSNWFCSTFNADLALSVTMTAISNLMAIGMLPLNLIVYSKLAFGGDSEVDAKLDLGAMALSLSVTISGILLGLVCSAKVHSFVFNRIMNKLGSVAGLALLLFSIFATGGKEEGSKTEQLGFFDHPGMFYVGVALPVFLGLVFSNAISIYAKLLDPERVTVSIECCYQNTGIATTVAIAMFSDGEPDKLAKALAVPLYYTTVNAIVLVVYCLASWKAGWTKAPPNEKLYTILFESYEVILSEEVEMEAIEVILGCKIAKEKISNGQDESNNRKRGTELVIYYPDHGTIDSPKKRIRRQDTYPLDVEHGMEIIPHDGTTMEAWYPGKFRETPGVYARVRGGQSPNPFIDDNREGKPDVYFNCSSFVAVNVELTRMNSRTEGSKKSSTLYSRVVDTGSGTSVDEKEAYVDMMRDSADIENDTPMSTRNLRKAASCSESSASSSHKPLHLLVRRTSSDGDTSYATAKDDTLREHPQLAVIMSGSHSTVTSTNSDVESAVGSDDHTEFTEGSNQRSEQIEELTSDDHQCLYPVNKSDVLTKGHIGKRKKR
mmetsp:Transcript_50163/g.98170  ORF Transcript_50163/g.98170 Transcript_50163/m.98170 type:complete len:656 (+) Transcript_50163:411-2378(+)